MSSLSLFSACWGVSALLSTPPLFNWCEYGYIWEQSFCFCVWSKSESYAFFMIGVCFGVPFSVMTVCNILLFRTFMTSKRKVMPSRRSRIDSNCQAVNRDSNMTKRGPTPVYKIDVNEENSLELSHGSMVSNDSKKTRRKSGESTDKGNKLKKVNSEIRLATALAIVIVVFVICWLPYCISMILSIFLPGQIPPAFHMASLLVGYFNSGCNPIIYGLMNKRFGKEFRRLFSSLLVCKRCLPKYLFKSKPPE